MTLAMTKYIDREALVIDLDHRHDFLEEMHGGCDQYTMGFLEAVLRVENFLSADAVPVVRCKDCIHSYEEFGFICCTCGPYVDCVVQPEFYCADGKERRMNNGVCNTL